MAVPRRQLSSGPLTFVGDQNTIVRAHARSRLRAAVGSQVASRRAQALLSIGACDLALEAAAPYARDDDKELHKQCAKARERQQAIGARLAAALVAPAAAEPDPLLYVGPLALRRTCGPRGIGWVAAKPIRAHELLFVEAAAVHILCRTTHS